MHISSIFLKIVCTLRCFTEQKVVLGSIQLTKWEQSWETEIMRKCVLKIISRRETSGCRNRCRKAIYQETGECCVGDQGTVWGHTINLFGRTPVFKVAELEPEAVSVITGEAGRCSVPHLVEHLWPRSRTNTECVGGGASESKGAPQGSGSWEGSCVNTAALLPMALSIKAEQITSGNSLCPSFIQPLKSTPLSLAGPSARQLIRGLKLQEINYLERFTVQTLFSTQNNIK